MIVAIIIAVIIIVVIAMKMKHAIIVTTVIIAITVIRHRMMRTLYKGRTIKIRASKMSKQLSLTIVTTSSNVANNVLSVVVAKTKNVNSKWPNSTRCSAKSCRRCGGKGRRTTSGCPTSSTSPISTKIRVTDSEQIITPVETAPEVTTEFSCSITCTNGICEPTEGVVQTEERQEAVAR